MRFLKILFLTYLVLALIVPYQTFADELDTQMARSRAERAANNDVSKACWFGAGLTIIGAGIAMMWPSSSPDPAEFTGKSPEYIRTYTDAYKSRAKKIQTMYSYMGCGVTLTMAACAISAIRINEGCNDWTDENCFPSCYSSSEEESCISNDDCGSGGDDGSSCGSSDGGSSCGSSSGG
jgi:hypothetical protein